MMPPPCPSASCAGTATTIAALQWQMPAQHPLPCQLLGTVNLELGPPLLRSDTHQDMCLSDARIRIDKQQNLQALLAELGKAHVSLVTRSATAALAKTNDVATCRERAFTCCSPAAH